MIIAKHGRLRAARTLGVRGSIVAILVAAAGSAPTAWVRSTRWARRRAIAAHHRQAGWQ